MRGKVSDSAATLRKLSGDPDRIRTGDLCLDRAVC